MATPGALGTTPITVEWRDHTFSLECFDNPASRRMSANVLRGHAYPPVDLVRDVQVVLDVGANVGAAALYFDFLYPEAEVFAFEPARDTYALLERNTASLARVHTYNVGLHATDDTVPLYRGRADSGCSSIYPSASTTDDAEMIRLRSAKRWVEEHAVTRIDVLKLDTEGCEVPILEVLAPMLADIRIVHLEFHSEDDRKTIDRLLGDTHVLLSGRAMVGIGQCTYLENRALVGS